jgi:7-keto-8-aminopelargonate synthetase-like enzyme
MCNCLKLNLGSFCHFDDERLGAASGSRGTHQGRARGGGLPVMPSETHIVPVVVGDPENSKAASDLLLTEHGIYIQPTADEAIGPLDLALGFG